MNELDQLLSQQLDLLQNQLKLSEEVVMQLSIYSKQLIEKNDQLQEENNLLKEENNQKSLLISTLKSELSNLKLEPLSNGQLMKYRESTNQILQQQLNATLTEKNLQSMVDTKIESMITPYQKELLDQSSKLSTLNLSSSSETDLSRLEGQVEQLTDSLNSLQTQLARLI